MFGAKRFPKTVVSPIKFPVKVVLLNILLDKICGLSGKTASFHESTLLELLTKNVLEPPPPNGK